MRRGMTEREMFLNMLARVTGEEGENNFYRTEGNDIVISNDSLIETTFEFNDMGELIWFY